MKQFASLLFMSFLAMTFQASAEVGQGSRIDWMTNYESAVNLSQSSSKPILLFFTGSDWCSWCKKLEEEVLNTPEFAQDAADKFIFVKLDFPINGSLAPDLTAQNKQLQKKFDVRSFPTIVVINSKQQRIGVTGYRPGGGRSYASHLSKMVTDYSSYNNQMQHLQEQNLSGGELKQLYEKARELSLENDANQIVKVGMQSDEKLFFLTERYRFLANEGQIGNAESIIIRTKLLTSDPNNEKMIHYNVAVIDFESCCEQMEKEKSSPEMAFAPLTEYIEKFGEQDKDHLWQLQMIISQVYLDHDKLPEALKYAEYSYSAAPSSAQKEIATAIKNIQSQITTHNHR
jgi:protein disulfide-isomerase